MIEVNSERERQLLVKALAYATEAMKYVRLDLAEPRYREDMGRLLEALSPDIVDLFALKLDARRRFAA
jgi:hypothetical protein